MVSLAHCWFLEHTLDLTSGPTYTKSVCLSKPTTSFNVSPALCKAYLKILSWHHTGLYKWVQGVEIVKYVTTSVFFPTYAVKKNNDFSIQASFQVF